MSHISFRIPSCWDHNYLQEKSMKLCSVYRLVLGLPLLISTHRAAMCAHISCHLSFLAHLWCAYAIPLALSVVRRPSSVVCVVSSNLSTADMKEII